MLIHKEKRNVRKEKKPRDKFSQLSPVLPLRYDIYRKITHLVVLGIIFLYFTPDLIIEIFDSVNNVMVFAQDLVVFLVGVSLIGLLTADISRILLPEFYPLKPINQILKKKELHMRLGPHISMSIGCFSIILFFGLFQPVGPVIICAAMAMAILGDIASNLVGRAIGRTKIRNTNKTYEGLFAGIITAFLSGLLVLKVLEYVYRLENFGIFLIPVLGGIIIGSIDYLDLEIDDNLSYNIITSAVLFFASILLF
jgi:dolichol kinase